MSSSSLPPLPDSILFSIKRQIHPTAEAVQDQSTSGKKQRVPEENRTQTENTAIIAMTHSPFSGEALLGEDSEIPSSQIQDNIDISALRTTITNQQDQINTLQKMVETFISQQQKPHKAQLVNEEGKCYYRGSVNSDNKPHGKGTWYYNNGTLKGSWKDGKPHGYTFYEGVNGDTFSATYVDNIQKGFGIYNRFYTQQKYKGDFERGKPHGKVSLKLSNGDKFVGMWENGRKNGKGLWKQPGGIKLEGTWKDDICTGNGVIFFKNGCTYKGEIKPNVNWHFIAGHGQGEMINTNGFVSKGNWVDGLLHGQGTLKDPKGFTYEGNFERGNKSGPGTETDKSGNVNIGFWQDSRFTVLKRECSNGNVEEGEFDHRWRLNGRGKTTFASGRVEEGLWWNGRFIDSHEKKDFLHQGEAVVICEDIYNRYKKENGPNEVSKDFFKVDNKEKYQIMRDKIRVALHPDNNITFSSAQNFFNEFCNIDNKKIYLVGAE